MSRKHNVIINSQYGFQNKVSTNHAFIDVIAHSYDNINSNQFTGLVFLDLTKAFDSVNHNILLLKLEHYGIRGSVNQLIKLFFSSKQFVSIKGAKSKLLQNNYGVPQGSILGSLLFLLYVNQGCAIYGPRAGSGPLVPAETTTIVCMDINFG